MNLAYKIAITALLLSWVGQSSAQQAMPQTCIQSVQRTEVCPNLLYKRSPIDVAQLEIKEGDMICLCMADFSDLRIRALSEPQMSRQALKSSRMAADLGIPAETLLQLIRR